MVPCQRFKYTIISVLFLLLSFGQALFAGDLSLQKPKVYTSEEEITGWVMSEKLDGIRGYWNGKKLLTRKGLPLNPPSIGTIVTFKYYGFTKNGIPKFASFLRVRQD